MAYNKDQVEKKIMAFVESLKGEISVDGVILFGSYAWGHPKSHSDIDVAIISRNFRDKDEMKDTQYLFKKAAAIDPIIEPLPFHPRDLKNADPRGLLFQIKKKGLRIPRRHKH